MSLLYNQYSIKLLLVFIFPIESLYAGSSSNLVAQEALRKQATLLKHAAKTGEQISSKNQTSYFHYQLKICSTSAMEKPNKDKSVHKTPLKQLVHLELL